MYKCNGVLDERLRRAVSKEPRYGEKLIIIYLPQITIEAKMCFRY